MFVLVPRESSRKAGNEVIGLFSGIEHAKQYAIDNGLVADYIPMPWVKVN